VILLLAYGGRDFADLELLNEGLSLMLRDTGFTVLMHGGARGADMMSDHWARKHQIHVACVAALWDYVTPSRSAGPRRNEVMADFRPSYGAAFPGGRGTADMTRLLKGADIPVHEFARG
jgi:hypothetical protein